ncbi:hypothetical protein KSP40_PGU008067 [Platanthera guangdongensis]|uniref:Bulb-type lectin domain-containing protein n=1 Tax=Platanthera guangdongensis TaxID=2320717 RepID=A0ABR2MNY8_9ASPA
MQEDCNLVVTHNEPLRIVVWATNTANKGHGCALELKDDCELKVRSDNFQTMWTNNVRIQEQNRRPCKLQLEDNNLYLVDADKKRVWQQTLN